MDLRSSLVFSLSLAAIPLTSEELLARLENSPQIDVLRARIERARAEVTRTGTLENPSLSFQREDVASSPENFATIELPLEISGRRGKNVDAAEVYVRATEADVAQDTFAIELEALVIYYAAVAARSRVEVLHSLRGSIALRVDELKKRAGAGDASGFDLGRLEIELAAHDDLLDRERTEHVSLQRALSVIAGEPKALFEPTETLTTTAPSSLSSMLEGLFDRRSDHRAAKLRKESAVLALSGAGRGWIPSLVISGGVKTAEAEDQLKLGYVAGVGFNLPFFDRGQADRDRALADLREASAELRRLELEIPAAIAQAHQTLSITLAQTKRFETEVLPRLDALVRRAETTYREGERPVFELLDAYRTAREHRLRHVELLFNAKRSELELRRAIGAHR